MDAYQQYIHKSRYARYLPEEQRRETWEETIDRYLNFWIEKGKLTLEDANSIFGPPPQSSQAQISLSLRLPQGRF